MADRKRKEPPQDDTPEQNGALDRQDTPNRPHSSDRRSSVRRGPCGRASRQEDGDRGVLSGQGNSHIPDKATLPSTDSRMLSPSLLDSLLLCSLCQDNLRQPTTLHCGHSVCALHVTTSLDSSSPNSLPPAHPSSLPLCPLPDCPPKSRQSSALPPIPSSSRVHYHPSPNIPPILSSPQPKSVPEPRLDVTLNKVIGLVTRTKQLLEGLVTQQEHLGTESDTDSSPYSSAHDHSARRPHKRRRRHLSPPHEEDHDDDLLSHLRKQATRQCTLRHDEPILPSLSSSRDVTPAHSKEAILAHFEKDLLVELTCEICFVLLYQPITTPCQHTFCAKCLQRSLDHSPACPLCRQDLPGFAYFQDHPTNKTLLSIIFEAFPMLYEERAGALAAEERDARLDTPIFVCQLSFPGMPTLLHFFEPRYRLMLRRCLESPNPRFGMIMAPKPGAGSPQIEYGTMLEIRSVQMLPDGRSMVETRGTFRFRILERGTLDGYMVGRIERIDDYPEDLSASSFLFPSAPSQTVITTTSPPELSSSSSTSSQSVENSSSSTHSQTPPPPTPLPIPIHPNSPTNEDLMSTCRSFLDRLQQGTAPWVVQRLSSTYGPMPTDPSAFSFWVALVLPIDEHEKAKLLPLRSARLRLLLLVHWIEQLNNQWYAFVWRVVACLVWTAFVLTISRLVGFI